MDVSFLIRQRLTELGLEQKGLATAAEVTESYISQLMTRKKLPPAPARTDIYQRIEEALQIPAGELARLAELQRQLELTRRAVKSPEPLFADFRALVLRKCVAPQQKEIARIFAQEPFGDIERLVAQRILDVAQALAREELRSEHWIRSLARVRGCTYQQMRVILLEFLEADVLHVSSESCVSLLDPMLDSWSLDRANFALDIMLNPRLAPARLRRFTFAEAVAPPGEEPGFTEFLRTPAMSAGATASELDHLRQLRFIGARRPNAFFYYRALQGLRDPLHFTEVDQTRS